ncbi:HORMA domain containing protein [Trichuris trichiura]|uniref:HORMA domain containing protein n=1 Tax=Trichuris trichiura TaxID=36087 RepID=A0A077Z034_TRITR|nr:HORMA domain containing protein [Trichuris trichiura]
MEVRTSLANDQTESIHYVKTFIALAISSICYYRKLFPVDVYEDYEYEGAKLKILIGRRDNAIRLIQCMKGCYDCIDRQYLRQIMFGVCDNCEYSEVLTDCYIFTIHYADDGGAALRLYTSGNDLSALSTKGSALQILQTIRKLCQHLEPLPKEAGISLKIVYYDERTPLNYQPVGFMPGESELFSYREKSGFSETIELNMGKVETQFHALQVGIKYASYTGNQINRKELPTSSFKHEHHPTNEDHHSPVLYDRLSKKCQLLAYHQVCKCLCEREHVEPAMLFCVSCKTFQHSVCYGKAANESSAAAQVGNFHLFFAASAPLLSLQHDTVCLQCALKNSAATCHDPSMVSLEEDQAKGQCLYRQALYFLLKSRSMFVSKTTLRLQLNIGYTDLFALCSSLIKDGCVQSKSAQVLSVQRRAILQQAKILFDGSITKVLSKTPRLLNEVNPKLFTKTS